MDIIDKLVNEDADDFNAAWDERINSGEFDEMTEEEYSEAWVKTIVDYLTTMVPSIGYLEPQTISVQVTKDDEGVYCIDDGDFQRIDSLIIQY